MTALPLTVVTIGLNARDGLQQTVASVRAQTYPAIHHVMIDGGSSDGSVEWLKELPVHDPLRPHTWTSEPDTGIYDAMNKALKHVTATGYLLYLHAGDSFVDDQAVERAMRAIAAATPMPDLAIGWSRLMTSGRVLPYVVGGATPTTLTSAHESTFFSTDFHHNERYDTAFQFAADSAFFRDLLQRDNLRLLRLNTTVSNFALGGKSNDPRYDGQRFLERARVNVRFGVAPTAVTYVKIALRMVIRSMTYRIFGPDKAGELFLKLASRRRNSGARALPLGEYIVTETD